MAAKIIGLDIGSWSVKALELTPGKRNYSISYFATAEIPGQPHTISKGDRTVITALQQLIQKKKLPHRKIAMFVWDADTNIDLMKLPVMPEKEIQNTLRWEVAQAKNLDVNDVSMDFILLDITKDRGVDKQSVLVTNIAKRHLLDSVEALKKIGLEPIAVDAKELAVCAAFLKNATWEDDEVIGLLEIGHKKSFFQIIINGKLHFTSPVASNGNALTEAIQQQFNINYSEAEELKHSQGLRGSGEEPVEGEENKPDAASVLNKVAERLVTDVTRIFKYYSFQVTGSSIQKMDTLYLSGGTANMFGLPDFMASRLEMDVKVLNPLSKVEIGKNPNLPRKDAYPELSVAVGLAMRKDEA